MSLRDYPVRGGRDWNIWAAERGHWIPTAEKLLPKFARWYEREASALFRTRPSVLVAASVFCQMRGLPNRFPLEQTLCQLYEQQALGEYNPYPPHTEQHRRWFDKIVPYRRRRGPPKLALA
jgi:hypothetical protein